MRFSAREHFARNDLQWDPSPPSEGQAPDLGRGLLDSFALALHVLWVYQEAWAEEGFIDTARLDASVHRLLALIGYRPSPGTAAIGYQHFRCKAGTEATLGPGFMVRAKAEGDLQEAVFETLAAVRVSAALNEMRPFSPTSGAAPLSTAGAIAAVSPPAPDALPEDHPLAQAESQVPGALQGFGSDSLVDQLEGRVGAARAGNLAQRNAVRARQDALKLADMISQLEQAGGENGCPEAIEQLCSDLCELQALANEIPEPATPGRLSESQELLLQQLTRMAQAQPQAVAQLQEALGRCEGESDDDWSRRLDQMANFLDALVAGLLQEARDQIVRLRGPDALAHLDEQLGTPTTTTAAGEDRGVAAPGGDSLFLLPGVGDPETGSRTHADLLRPGDWLVLAEDIRRTTPDGQVRFERRYREVVQVVRVSEERPAGRAEAMTRITFRPPLRRRYNLARTLVLGNIAEISHGQTVSERGVQLGLSAPTIGFARGPLTWLRDAKAPDGRRPLVSLRVAGRRWDRTHDLRRQDATGALFAVELDAEGGASVRVGDGEQSAALPSDTDIELSYRIGLGQAGNREGGAVSELGSTHPALGETFNPLPTVGGADPESIDQAQRKAGFGIHALDRAISMLDLRSLAETYDGILCARATRDPLRRREHLRVVVCGEDAAALSDTEREQLRRFLTERLPPGVTVSVTNRLLVAVRARIRIWVTRGDDPLSAIGEIRLRLGLDRADDRTPGLLDTRKASLGRDLILSDLYACLDGLEGVERTQIEALHRADAPSGRSERIRIADTEVALWADADVTGEALEVSWEEATAG
jgi:hypothetical protein